MEQKPKEEALIIDPPHELRFCGPFNKPVVTVLRLSNATNRTVLFKIKTTAPKRYCVRPNFDAIQPGGTCKVEICLQPFTYDVNEKNKHKFMVQSLIAPEDCDNYGKLWKDMEPDQLMDAKLKCVFEMPPSAANAESSGTVTAIESFKKEIPAKPLPEEKISNLMPSDKTDILVGELRQSREENSELRKENLNLKEQVIRLRVSSAKPPTDEPYAPIVERQIPVLYIALALLSAFIGLVLGKYLL